MMCLNFIQTADLVLFAFFLLGFLLLFVFGLLVLFMLLPVLASAAISLAQEIGFFGVLWLLLESQAQGLPIFVLFRKGLESLGLFLFRFEKFVHPDPLQSQRRCRIDQSLLGPLFVKFDVCSRINQTSECIFTFGSPGPGSPLGYHRLPPPLPLVSFFL